MPNVKDLRPDSTSSILVGPPKSGKTRSLGTWLAAGPMLVYSFDAGHATLAGLDIDVEVFYDKDRYQPKAWSDFNKHLDATLQEVLQGRSKYKVLGFDNLTFAGRSCINFIQFTNRTIDKPVGYDGYRMLLNKMSDVVTKAKASGIHVVMTAEEKTEKDEVTGEIETLPAIEGSYRESIVAEFDFAFYCRVGRDLKDPRKPRYFWQTVPDHRIKCAGSRWDCGLEVEEVPDFGNVMRKIKNRFPHVGVVQTARAA